MKRHPAFDPPEYRHWTPDPALVREYRGRLEEHGAERAVHLAELGSASLLGIYRDLLITRLQDTGLKRWVRQGVISKAWLGVGEEAVTVGCVAALDRRRDVVIPMIRNAGACHMMGLPLEHGFKCYLATSDSPSGGRDFHYGDISRGVIQPVSHMGDQRLDRRRGRARLQEPGRGARGSQLGRRRGHPHRRLPRGNGPGVPGRGCR